MTIEFRECATCAAKPGSPTLCESCLANRHAINELVTECDRLKERVGQLLSDRARLWQRLWCWHGGDPT